MSDVDGESSKPQGWIFSEISHTPQEITLTRDLKQTRKLITLLVGNEIDRICAWTNPQVTHPPNYINSPNRTGSFTKYPMKQNSPAFESRIGKNFWKLHGEFLLPLQSTCPHVFQMKRKSAFFLVRTFNEVSPMCQPRGSGRTRQVSPIFPRHLSSLSTKSLSKKTFQSCG